MADLAKPTAVALSAIAGLHVAWGAGSSFPFSDPAVLADRVAGTTSTPRPPECFAVAGFLLAAAGIVGGVLPLTPRVRHVGCLGVAAVLGGRGVLGVSGRTGAVVPWAPSAAFDRLDRRYYGPLCLALAGGAVSSARP